MKENICNCNTCNTGKSGFKFCSGNCDEKINLQKYSSKIGDIITEQTNSDDSTFIQLLNTSKKMAIDFFDVASNQWISLSDGTSRNIKTGEIKENEELLSDFLKNYIIKK